MSTKIYGASDDLLEFDGYIEEEFEVNSSEPFYIGLSDGTLLRMEYDDNAIWRIQRVKKGLNDFQKTEGDVEQDTVDVVTITGELSWVLIGTERIVRKK